MASELRLTTLANNAGTESVDTTYVINGSAKEWCNFQGTTSTIRDSLNVASLTDNGAGDFSVNYTNSMSNSDYSSTTSVEYNSFDGIRSTATTFRRYAIMNSGDSYEDRNTFCTQTCGDLA